MLAAATVGSRALGLVREVVVAALFGASDAKAAYVIGYYVPFFVQRLLIGGTLSIVLIPTLAEALARGDPAEIQAVASRLFTAVLAAGLAMVAAGAVLAPGLVRLAAPGFAADPAQFSLTVALTRINFLAMFFLALAIFATAFLQARRRFAPPAVAPLVFNAVIIAGVLLLGPRIGIVGLSVAWIAGTAAQFLVQVPALRAGGFRFRWVPDWSHPAIRTVRRLAVPAMVGLAVVEINAYVGRFLASLLPGAPGVNAVAVLDYAFEMVQAPVGILAISVATVLFPGMSEQAAAGDRAALRRTASLGVRAVLFLTLPVSVGLVVFAQPVVRLVFERGEFGPATTAAVSACMAAYAAGLVPMAAYYVVTRAYYAMRDMRTPVAVGAAMVVLNAGLAYALMRAWGVAGIALAAAAVALANVAVLLALLSARLGALEGRRIIGTGLRVGLATALAIGAGWWLAGLWSSWPGTGWLADAAALGSGGTAAVLIYLGACALLRVDEVGLLRGLMGGRIRS